MDCRADASSGGHELALDVELMSPPGMGSSQQQPPRMAVIPKVRERLRRVSGELFTPQTMPIGPYFHQSKRKDSISLPWTAEEKKKKAALHVLKYFGHDRVHIMEDMLYDLTPRVMRCYTHLPDDHEEDPKSLNHMLLLDGCYLLSLFLEGIQQQEMKAAEPIGRDFAGPMILTQDSATVRDILYLLENQVPLVALCEMLDLLARRRFEQEVEQDPLDEQVSFIEYIAKPVEYVLEKHLYISSRVRRPTQEDAPSDLLHLVHYYFRCPRESLTGQWRQASGFLHGMATRLYLMGHWRRQRWDFRHRAVYGLTSPWRRATYYRRYADLRFRRREFKYEEEWTILDIELQGGTLSIPLLRVDSTTWTMLRNLMALEEQLVDRPVTAYCYFMSQVACTAEDVELLQRARILEHFLGSDEQAAKGFAELCDGVDLDVDKLELNYLSPVLHELDKRCSMPVHNLKGLFRERYCGNMFQRLVFSMAVVLFILQVTQVIYAALAYHKPPKAP